MAAAYGSDRQYDLSECTAIIQAYLHDELDGTNEIHEELEDHVLLLLLHLIETELLSPGLNLGGGQTSPGVGLE